MDGVSDTVTDQIAQQFYESDSDSDLNLDSDSDSDEGPSSKLNSNSITSRKNRSSIPVVNVDMDDDEDDEVDDDDNEKTSILLQNINTFTDDDDIFHFAWIRNISALLQKQIKKTNAKAHICNRCFNYFYKNENVIVHKEKCALINFNEIKLPPPETYLELKNFFEQLEVPFYMVADLETLLIEVYIEDEAGKNTQRIQHHVPYSVCVYLHCTFDETKCERLFHNFFMVSIVWKNS